jgi:hypothetical protein
MLFSRTFGQIGFASLLLVSIWFPCSSSGQTNDSTSSTPRIERRWQAIFDGSFAMGPKSTPLYGGWFGLNYLVDDHVRIGLDDIGLASTSLISGTRYGLSIAPTVGYYTPLGSKFEGSLSFALPLQWRFGADLPSAAGLMPYFQAGLDLFLGDNWSLGLTEHGAYVLSDAYIKSSHALPARAMAITTGFALKYRF